MKSHSRQAVFTFNCYWLYFYGMTLVLVPHSVTQCAVATNQFQIWMDTNTISDYFDGWVVPQLRCRNPCAVTQAPAADGWLHAQLAAFYCARYCSLRDKSYFLLTGFAIWAALRQHLMSCLVILDECNGHLVLIFHTSDGWISSITINCTFAFTQVNIFCRITTTQKKIILFFVCRFYYWISFRVRKCS